MLQLNPRTIMFANFVYSGIISIYMLSFGIRSKRRLPGLNWWAYGFLLITLNFLILSFRNIVPLTITNILPHFCSALGYLFFKHGLVEFYGKKEAKWPGILFLTLFLIGLIALNHGSFHYRLILLIAGLITIFLLTLSTLWRIPDTGALKSLYIIALAAQLGRLWIGLRIPVGMNPMDSGNKLAVISMLFFLTQMAIALGLISITVKSLLKERDVLLDKERELSLYDELTGLMNRRGFKTVYQVEEKRIIRQRLPMSLVMADIDHFKSVNDQYGHECGDQVLKEIADIMRSQFRGGDLLARWGGEEFIIVQPETNEEECLIALERTRKALAAHIVKYPTVSFSITMSFGFLTVMAGGLSFDEVMKKADDNLYKAKKQGRNRVVGNTRH